MNPASGEYGLGIVGVQAGARRAALARLAVRDNVIPVTVKGIARQPLFIGAADLSLLGSAGGEWQLRTFHLG